MTTQTIKADVKIGREVVKDVEILAFMNHENTDFRMGMMRGVKAAYKFRTGAKIHPEAHIWYDAKNKSWYAPATVTVHNRHAYLVGVYDEKFSAVKAEWYPYGRNEKGV